MADTKKYGLIIKKKTAEKTLKKSTVFGNESSGDEDVPKSNINVSLMREAQKKKEMKQTQLEIEKALKEDPSVYEYDNIYDEMAEKKKAAIPKLAEKDRKPKYIKGLLESAKSRKMEDERRMERKIQKEREQEGGEFKEKEEFVTSAYRKRMLELQEEEERLKKQEALDAANDVTKKSDLTMFYSNLLKHNVSMGGSFSVDNRTADGTDNDRMDNLKQDKSGISVQTKGSRKDSERSRADLESRHDLKSSKQRDYDRNHREHERRKRSSSSERSYRRERADKHNTPRKDSEDSSRYSESRRDSDIRDKALRDEPYQKHKPEESSREGTKEHKGRKRRSSSNERSYRRERDGKRSSPRKDAEDFSRHSESRRDSNIREMAPRDEPRQKHKSEEISREEPNTSSRKEVTVAQSDVGQGEEIGVPSKFVKRSNKETISTARERFLERKRARQMLRKPSDSDED